MTHSIAPYKTRLNHGNAYWMARLSEAVYLEEADNSPDEEKILKNLKAEDPGFMDVHSFSEGNAQAILVEHKQYLCMAFRGTEEFGDWLDNIKTRKEELDKSGCKVHKGFLEQLDALWEKMEQKHTQIVTKDMNDKKDTRPLFFTGHSLGGAIATLATARWVLNGDRQFTSTYTFGQPRAITLEASRILNPMFGARFFRFHNNNDMVPRIPMRSLGYSHMGQVVYIDKDKDMHTDPGFWFRFQDRVLGTIQALKQKRFDQFADHSMDEYLYAVKNWDLQD